MSDAFSDTALEGIAILNNSLRCFESLRRNHHPCHARRHRKPSWQRGPRTSSYLTSISEPTRPLSYTCPATTGHTSSPANRPFVCSNNYSSPDLLSSLLVTRQAEGLRCQLLRLPSRLPSVQRPGLLLAHAARFEQSTVIFTCFRI